MEARYTIRKHQLLAECQVAPEIFEQVLPRLSTFMTPFVKIFQGQVAEQHAKTYVCGLLSNLERKNVESIAYRFGHSRLPLQAFIGWDAWDDEPLRSALRSQEALGPRRWGAGVRSLGVCQVGARVGRGGQAVVWSSGQSRQLSSGHLLGIRLQKGPYPGGPAAFSAQRMDEG